MDLVALTQYFDTLQVLGGDSRAKVIFLPSNPGAIGNYMNEIRTAFASGMEAEVASADVASAEVPAEVH